MKVGCGAADTTAPHLLRNQIGLGFFCPNQTAKAHKMYSDIYPEGFEQVGQVKRSSRLRSLTRGDGMVFGRLTRRCYGRITNMMKRAFAPTKDLVNALDQILDETPAATAPVAILAAYIDGLAKEYGLSESLHVATEATGRVRDHDTAMELVRHYLAEESEDLDDDFIRLRLYRAFVTLADDPQIGKGLNHNSPMSAIQVLHLAQIYWNLEYSEERPRLPIRPQSGSDIPVPGARQEDFAVMRWTKRVNVKAPIKSAGQSFRTQGARLSVFAAKQLIDQAPPFSPSPTSTTTGVMPITPTAGGNVELKTFIEQAMRDGDLQDAFDVAGVHLRIMQRRAMESPLALEPDLADAYFLKGITGHGLLSQMSRPAIGSINDTVENLQRARNSLETLCVLHPEDIDGRYKLARTLGALHEAHLRDGQPDPAIDAAKQAVGILWEINSTDPAGQTLLADILTNLYISLKSGDRQDEPLNVAGQLVTTRELLVTDEPSRQKELATALLFLGVECLAVQQDDEAVVVLGRCVEIWEGLVAGDPTDRDHQAWLALALGRLGEALESVGRGDEAVAVWGRCVEIWEGLLAVDPTDRDHQDELAAAHRHLGLALESVGQGDEAVAVGSRLQAEKNAQ